MLKELRRLRPADKITILCRKGLADSMRLSGLVDEAIEADKKDDESWHRAVEILSAKEFDLLVCPHQSFRSALLSRSIRARRKVGYKRWFNATLFDDRLERPMDLPEALRQVELLTPLDSSLSARLSEFRSQQKRAGGQGEGSSLTPLPAGLDMTLPRLVSLRSEFRSRGSLSGASSAKVGEIAARLGFAPGRRIAFLAPGSVWPTKMWTSEGFTGVARALIGDGFTVVLMGSRDERPICEAIASAAPGSHVIAGEPSLFETAELLALADLLVCNDSGAMHMAAASGVPTVSVFGPTVLELGYRPWNDLARVVQTDLPCRPCGKHGAKKCPLGTHACMKQISSDQVLNSIKSLPHP